MFVGSGVGAGVGVGVGLGFGAGVGVLEEPPPPQALRNNASNTIQRVDRVMFPLFFKLTLSVHITFTLNDTISV